MTDARQLIDYARKQFKDIADEVEQHFDNVAGSLRDRFSQALPSPPPRRLPPPTTLQLAQRWIIRHKALTAAIVAFVVTGSVGTFIYATTRHAKKRRRAHKSTSGARTDVVVVAGAVANPLTSALYLDLERRGFIVYVVANTAEDEHYIRSQRRSDLLSLSLDLVDPFTAQAQVARFQHLFRSDHYAFEGAPVHNMRFVGLVLVPDTQCAPAKVEDISSEEWSDALNAKVLNTIATTQLLLPSVIESKANVLMLTPTVTPAMHPPLHALESTAYGALQGFTSSLAAELKQDGVALSHVKLGNFDIPAVTARQRREGIPPPRLGQTPLRQLHDTVFDTLIAKRPPRTLHSGRGSLTYNVISNWAPPTLIAWMMGIGRRPGLSKPKSSDDMHGSTGSLTWDKIEDV